MLKEQIVKELTCGTVSVKHHNRMFVKLRKWNFVIEFVVMWIGYKDIRKVTDCFLFVRMIQVGVRKVCYN